MLKTKPEEEIKQDFTMKFVVYSMMIALSLFLHFVPHLYAAESWALIVTSSTGLLVLSFITTAWDVWKMIQNESTK